MCFAVGPERFVPRCGCSVTLLERREDGLGSFPVDSFPRRGARCSYFSTAPPPGRPFSFCAANSYALLVESRPPDRFAPLFVRPIRASASYEARSHWDDYSAGGYRRRAKIFLRPHGAGDRLNFPRPRMTASDQ
jgi:hypothetical protein